MARLFYNLYNGLGITTDAEGQETGSSEEARAICIKSIRAIVAEECVAGLIDLTGRIEVTDGDGGPLLTVPFDEAFEVKFSPD